MPILHYRAPDEPVTPRELWTDRENENDLGFTAVDIERAKGRIRDVKAFLMGELNGPSTSIEDGMSFYVACLEQRLIRIFCDYVEQAAHSVQEEIDRKLGGAGSADLTLEQSRARAKAAALADLCRPMVRRR